MGLMGSGGAAGENFGVDALSSHSAGGPGGGSANRTLKDHERGAGPPVDHNQANPDHGFPK